MARELVEEWNRQPFGNAITSDEERPNFVLHCGIVSEIIGDAIQSLKGSHRLGRDGEFNRRRLLGAAISGVRPFDDQVGVSLSLLFAELESVAQELGDTKLVATRGKKIPERQPGNSSPY